MLRWSLLFLIVALIAGFLGFWRLEGLAMWMAQAAFLLFLLMFVLSLFAGRRAPPV